MKLRTILLAPLLGLLPLPHAGAGTVTAITADVTVDTRTAGSVTIPDPALLAALRTALAKPAGDITVADLLTLTTLRIAGLGISDLTGLENATNLRILDIRRNNFTDPAALWAVLDQITPMYCLYTDVRRPGTDPAGLIVQTLTDTSGNSFFILVDAPNLPSLDFNSLDVNASSPANLQALQVIADAGVEVDTGGVNLPPYASAGASVSNAATRTVSLSASAGDVDGSIVSYAWSWPGGSASGANPSVILPYGITEVSLTVTDDDGSTATSSTEVVLTPLASVDSDGDGLNDLLEFACNLDTTRADRRPLTEATGTSGLPAVRLDNSTTPARLRIEFLRRKDAAAVGIAYEPQWSSDFTSWSSGAATTQVTSVDDQWERVVITDPSPGTRRFSRLAVSPVNPQ
jgi:hypothetical protein